MSSRPRVSFRAKQGILIVPVEGSTPFCRDTRFHAIAMTAVLLLTAAPIAAQDSTFLMVADRPAADFPVALGNGRFSMLTSPRGVSPTRSFLAGLYERARGDVPRIASLPAWNAIDVFNGSS